MYKPAKYIFILLLLSFCCNSFGQVVRPVIRRPFQQRVIRRQQTVNKIEEIRETYIGKKLNLTSEESQKFWPVYRRYWDEIKEVRRKKRINNSSAQANGTDQINNELYYETQLVNIRKSYTAEFLKIIPPDKVSEIFKAEREFQDELIKNLTERSEPVKTNP